MQIINPLSFIGTVMKKILLWLLLYISHLLMPNNLFGMALKTQLQNLQDGLGGLKGRLDQLQHQLTHLKTELENKGASSGKKLVWKTIENIDTVDLKPTDEKNPVKNTIDIRAAKKNLKTLEDILKIEDIARINPFLQTLEDSKLEALKAATDALQGSCKIFPSLSGYAGTFASLEILIEQTIAMKKGSGGTSGPGTGAGGSVVNAKKAALRNKLKNAKSIENLESFSTLFADVKLVDKEIAKQIIEDEWNLMLDGLKQKGLIGFQTQPTRSNLAQKIVDFNLDKLIQLSGFPPNDDGEEILKQKFKTTFINKTGVDKTESGEECYNFFQRTINEVIDGANPAIEKGTNKAVHTVVQELRSGASASSKPAKPTLIKKDQKTPEEKAELLKKMIADGWDFKVLSRNLSGIEKLNGVEKENLKNLIIARKDTVNVAGKNTLSKALKILGLTEEKIIEQGFPKPPIVPTSKPPIRAKPSTSSSGGSSETETGGTTSSGGLHPAQQKDNLTQILDNMKKALAAAGGPPPPPPPPPPPGGPSAPPSPAAALPGNLYDLNKNLTDEDIEVVINNRGGIEKLPDIQKAGLKHFVEKKKAQFMANDEGKEVLAKLGIS